MKSIKDEIECKTSPMGESVSKEFGDPPSIADFPLSSLFLNLIDFKETTRNMMIESVYNHEINIS
jgi:hypothetical protein